MKSILHENCYGVRGIKSFNCIKCGEHGINYSNGMNICDKCSKEYNLCKICGKEVTK